MSENNIEKKTISAYQQLSGILNSLKKNEITLNDAMNKIQLKEFTISRPYCKVTNSGALALYGISKQPIVMYAEQWNKLNKLIQNNYIDNYIKYNNSRLLYKKKYYDTNSDDINNDDINSDDINNDNEEDLFISAQIRSDSYVAVGKGTKNNSLNF